MCDDSHPSNSTVEGSTTKRHKHTSNTGLFNLSEGNIVLPPFLKSWITHIGVDVDEYAHSLYQVANGMKKRYYRLQQSTCGTKSRCSCTSNLSIQTCNPQDCNVHVPCLHKGCARLPVGTPNYEGCDEHTSMPENKHIRTAACSSPAPLSVNHPPVRWLRDVDLYECYESIPKNAMGLDAASAAVVDSLRLREVCHEDGTKWILDMCCAPGGKLLAIVSCLKRLCREGLKWKVIGLDTVKRRMDVCASFLKKENPAGAIDVSLVYSRGQDFTEFEGSVMLGRFDRVMVDAECTHEGSLRSVVRTLRYWGSGALEGRFTAKHAETIICNQRELLLHAIRLVRPGGLVVYSTCSLHDEQNELLVSGVVQEFNDIKLQQLPTAFCECCSDPPNRTDKWPAISTESFLSEHCDSRYFPDRERSSVNCCANEGSPVCVRFSPLSGDTDGIFIAAIRKARK